MSIVEFDTSFTSKQILYPNSSAVKCNYQTEKMTKPHLYANLTCR